MFEPIPGALCVCVCVFMFMRYSTVFYAWWCSLISCCILTGTVLNKASHWTLLNELNQMSPKWRILGLGLHLSHDKLNDIGWPSSEDDLNKLSKVIVEWLQQSTPPPTLNYLLHVLRSPVMGEMLLAARIEKKYSANISSVPSEKQSM